MSDQELPRNYCQDHTDIAQKVNKRDLMHDRHRLAVREWWSDQVHQLLLIAPLLIFILMGWVAVLLGWV